MTLDSSRPRGCKRRQALVFAVAVTACPGYALPAWSQNVDAGADQAPPHLSTGKTAVRDRLFRLNQSGQFLFGQQHATLWGMYLGDRVIPTNAWFDQTARTGRFTSDSAALVGDDPAVLGVSLQMLAFEPLAFGRRPVIAQAIRHHFAQGGLVTMEWHAPSCNARLPSAASLATVKVDGREVALHAVAGGTFFYAEEEYAHAIASRADVPDSLLCLCQIANDRMLGAGPYQGISGKAWLSAHAKYAAQVMRDEGLADLPIIVRPFHEHNGSWFWWGQPYWNCAALLDQPDAITGAAAYQTVVRTFITSLREEPGMGELLFAYSPGKLPSPGEGPGPTKAERKLVDPMQTARDRLRARLVRELEAAHLAYRSPAEARGTVGLSQATSQLKTARYVADRRRHYAEAYAGDDVFDVLGIDLYHPLTHPANRTDLRLFRLQLRALADEAQARGKPYALTEAGTLRLQLLQLNGRTGANQALNLHSKKSVDSAMARLFAASDRTALLRHYALTGAGPVALTPKERARLIPTASEDWYGRQLLVLAKEAKVAYALVWHTYFDGPTNDAGLYYFVPYPGHSEARSFERFYADPATCFLHDMCAH